MQTNHLCWNETNEAIWELRSNSLFNLLACWAEILLDIIVKIPSKVHFNWASSCMATIRSSGTITVLAKYITTSKPTKWPYLTFAKVTTSGFHMEYLLSYQTSFRRWCPLAKGPKLHHQLLWRRSLFVHVPCCWGWPLRYNLLGAAWSRWANHFWLLWVLQLSLQLLCQLSKHIHLHPASRIVRNCIHLTHLGHSRLPFSEVSLGYQNIWIGH